jgi:hypothetical protein
LLNPHDQKLKSDVETIGLGRNLTVIMADGKQYHGAIWDVMATGFQVLEVDAKQLITIEYGKVKKVYGGYGGKGFRGKRVNPRRELIVVIGVLAGLLALAAVAARD